MDDTVYRKQTAGVSFPDRLKSLLNHKILLTRQKKYGTLLTVIFHERKIPDIKKYKRRFSKSRFIGNSVEYQASRFFGTHYL